MYIAVDISDSLTKEDIEKSTKMVQKLMERVSEHVHTHDMWHIYTYSVYIVCWW